MPRFGGVFRGKIPARVRERREQYESEREDTHSANVCIRRSYRGHAAQSYADVGHGLPNLAAMSVPQPVTPANPVLVEHLRDQVRLGADMSRSILSLRTRYSDDEIVAALDELTPNGNSIEQGVYTPPLLRRAPAKLRRVERDGLHLYMLEDALSPNECASWPR